MTSQVAVQRAEIEEQIAGRTLCHAFADVVAAGGDSPAYSDRTADGQDWRTITWGQAGQLVPELAAGLAELGLAAGERVALMMPNRSEHVLADLAVVHAGGVPVTFYATLSGEQIGYLAANCDARIAIVAGRGELDRLSQVLPGLPGLAKVIVLDPAACPDGDRFITWADFAALGERRHAADPSLVADRAAHISPDDPLTLLYTSGTTGNPKGVILTHRNVLYGMTQTRRDGDLPDRVRWVSYLPLAHIAERMFSIYLPLTCAGHVSFCPDAQQLIGALGAVRPTGFFGVPRVWEKVQAGLRGLMDAEPDPAKRAAVEQAMLAGRRYVQASQDGQPPPPDVAAAFAQADELVLRPIRGLLGLGEATAAVSAAAPLPPDVAHFFAGLGMKILDVYGMTETTGAFTANREDAFKLGTVGRPVAGHEVKIADDGEILTRGPLNTPGYLDLPEATAELIDADGWLHTGDIGTLDADGYLSVVDRKKELIITSGGENVSPAAVENVLVEHALIGAAAAYGDRRPYVVALLTLDPEAATAWAQRHSVQATPAELASHPDILAEIEAAVTAANTRLARVQQVKRWTLLPAEWTPESGELTPTLKLKRRIIYTRYASDLDKLYT